MWIARDANGRLYIYFHRKPVKHGFFWCAYGDYTEIIDKFPSVKFEDPEPTKVEYNEKNELVICG